VVQAYDNLLWFQSCGETTHEMGFSRQWRGMENGVGSKALTGEGCWGRQSKGAVAALSSFRCSCATKKGKGEGEGYCGCGESKREAVDVGIH
jgi:hypothetical protein